MVHWEIRRLWILGLVVRDHQSVIGFSLKVNFDNVPSVLTKSSKLTVLSCSQDWHQSFRAQTVVLLSRTSSSCKNQVQLQRYLFSFIKFHLLLPLMQSSQPPSLPFHLRVVFYFVEVKPGYSPAAYSVKLQEQK